MKSLQLLTLFFLFSVINGQVPDSLPSILDNRVSNVKDPKLYWEKERKPNIMKSFSEEVYGKLPEGFSPSLSFTIIEEEAVVFNGLGNRKQIAIHLVNDGDTLSFDLLVYLPLSSNDEIPVFIGLNFYGNHTIHSDTGIRISQSWVRNNKDFNIYNNRLDERSRGVRVNRWPIEAILSRGYGLATIYYGDIDPDFNDGFQNGLHGLFTKNGDYPDNWAGSITAWAYGLSSAMNYFEKDDRVDEKRVIVFGHSRLGKAALWAGAMDERFAMVISNNSGCGGAALSMRKYGETVKKINDQFPHWFSDNFLRYNDNEEALPVDQHMLLALIAPRPLYVASAVEDQWADPYGEQLSAHLAAEVYEMIYDKAVRVPLKPAVINQAVKTGFIGYHLRTGKHDLTAYDWEQFLDFADFHF
jgi:hypothetical protein